MLSFETLLLREVGYGAPEGLAQGDDWPAMLATFDSLGRHIQRYVLAERRSDVMAARSMLRDRLARIEGG
jgi:DNA repair protein RecO (recombination protein O)